MLACPACGRAWSARVLDPWSLSAATCPGCGGELHSRPPARRTIAGQPKRGRVAAAPARERLEERLTGLGA